MGVDLSKDQRAVVVGALAGGAIGVRPRRGDKFRSGNTNAYRVYVDGFASLAGWTPAGTVTASGGVVSLADVDASAVSLTKNLTLAGSALPTTQAYVVEIAATVPAGTGQKLSYTLSTGGTTVARLMVNGNGDNTVRLISENAAQVDVAPANFDCRVKFKALLWVDPVEKVVRFYLYWKDKLDATVAHMERLAAATPFGYATAPTTLTFSSGGAGTGTISVEALRIYRPWVAVIGDSIATGHPGYDPVPGFYVTQQVPYALGAYLEQLSGNRGCVLNQGIGGHDTEALLARYQTMVLDVRPETVVVEIGSNDAFSHALADAQGRLTTVVDACVGAGIRTLVVEIPPRDNMGAAENAWKAAWNAWLPGLCGGHGARLVPVHAALEDPANADHLLPAYTDDQIHPNAAGYAVMAGRVWARL